MADAALRIDPIRPRLRWDVLSATDVERLEAGILQTLAEVGVRFPLERALDALERGGCRVDRASQVARLPESVVRAALQGAPKAPLLAARDPRCDIVLDGVACHLSNDGCGVRVLDPDTGELRPSTKADVADSARFVDAVPQVSFYWGPVVTAEDVPWPHGRCTSSRRSSRTRASTSRPSTWSARRWRDARSRWRRSWPAGTRSSGAVPS